LVHLKNTDIRILYPAIMGFGGMRKAYEKDNFFFLFYFYRIFIGTWTARSAVHELYV